MSAPEYDQRAEDHRAILILLRVLNTEVEDDRSPITKSPVTKSPVPLSDHQEAFWNQLLQQVEQNDEIRITEPGLGYERVVRLRFKRNTYPQGNHEWADFQAHRRLCGVLSFGLVNKATNIDSLQLYERHTRTVNSYPGLLDNRCFLFTHRSKSADLAATKSIVKEPNNNQNELKSTNSLKAVLPETTRGHLKSTDSDSLKGQNSNSIVMNSQVTNGHSNRASQCLNLELDSDDPYEMNQHLIETIQREMQSLVASIFYVLESKRLDKSFEKQDRVPLLLAPFESKSLVGVDQDAKILKKKSLARMRKHLGDLCLLIGSPAEALNNYAAAVDQLRSSQDLLWLSAALEGQCIASLALLNPNGSSGTDSVETIPSPASDSPPDLSPDAAYENGTMNSSTNQKTPLYNNNDTSANNSTIPNNGSNKRTPLQRIFSIPAHRIRPALTADSTPPAQIGVASSGDASNASDSSSGKSSLTRSARHNLTRRFVQTAQSGQARSLPSSLDPMLIKLLGKSLLTTSEELFERYKEACCHYAKFKLAAVIELECSFKAARVLTKRGRYLLASEFLQNSVFIVYGRHADEQIKRLEVVAELYESIGFKRKSAFYRRFSALKTISTGLDKESWERCYYLLMPALSGYRLTLNSVEYTRCLRAKQAGWIGIHIQLLQELATMSRRMGCETLTQRHVAFLLQCLFEHLSVAQRVDLARQLMSLKLRVSNANDIAPEYKHLLHPNPVNLYKFPVVTRVELIPPAARLRPHLLTCLKKEASLSGGASKSPFIFTPMQLHRPAVHRRRSQPFVQTTDFCWVAGEPCYVLLHILNPLPCELRITEISLMAEPQSHFQPDTATETLAAEIDSTTLQLSGLPRQAGTLELTGYSLQVFGLNSYCRLIDLPSTKNKLFPSKYSIEIVPSLPLLDVSLRSVQRVKHTGTTEIIGDSGEHQLVQTDDISSISFQLYAGESRLVHLRLTNCSENGELIELMSGKIVTSLATTVRDQVLQFDCERLNQSLPIDQAQSIDLALPLFAHAQFTLAKAHCSSTTSNSRSDSPQHNQPQPATKRQLNSIGSTLANFLNELQATPKMMTKFTQEASPVRDAPQVITPAYQEYNVSLELEYSGGTGLVARYGRKHTTTFDLKVMPSLVITRWDVLPAETPDHCYLVFDVLNSTEYEMELQYSEHKSIIIEAGETCRIPVPVLRCMPPDHNGPVDLNQICRQHLKSQVQLVWTLLNNSIERRVSGVASIEEIEWSKQALDCILMASLSWNVRINGFVLTQNDEIKVRVGQLVNVRVEFRNCCGQTIRYLNLMLDCFQDQLNGKRRYNLNGKKAIVGKDRIHIHQLECQKTYVHECKYVFFYPGLYKLDIHCNGNEMRDLGNNMKAEIGKVVTSGILPPSSSCEKTVDWVFSPLVEIAVLE